MLTSGSLKALWCDIGPFKSMLSESQRLSTVCSDLDGPSMLLDHPLGTASGEATLHCH